jgi:hypothetical protein
MNPDSDLHRSESRRRIIAQHHARVAAATRQSNRLCLASMKCKGGHQRLDVDSVGFHRAAGRVDTRKPTGAKPLGFPENRLGHDTIAEILQQIELTELIKVYNRSGVEHRRRQLSPAHADPIQRLRG